MDEVGESGYFYSGGDALKKAIEVQNRHQEELLRYPNVTGVAVGYRQKGGKETDEVVIQVFVKKKLPKGELQPQEIIPSEIEGIPVDVKESSELLMM